MSKIVKLSISSLLIISAQSAQAGFIVIQGKDNNVVQGQGRPNSDAAAASFDLQASALAPLNIIDFENSPAGGFTSLPEADVFPGVFLTPFGGNTGDDTLILTSPDLFGFNTTAGGTKHLRISEAGPGEPAVGTTFNFSSPVFAFGSYLSGFPSRGQANPGLARIEFNDGTEQSIEVTGTGFNGGIQFLGFVNLDNPITSVSYILRPTGLGEIANSYSVDDFRFAANPVPEPSSLALLGMGAVSLFGYGWRRNKQ